MSLQVARKDPYLNEAIALLDTYYEQADFNQRAAFSLLSKGENEWVMAEHARCVAEPRYYLENYHVIRREDMTLTTLYPFWDSQEILWDTICHLRRHARAVKIIILKARQLGLSTIGQGLVFQVTIFNELVNTAVVAQDGDQAEYLVNMSKLAYDSLPWWLRPEKQYDVKGKHIVFDRKDEEERHRSPGLRSQYMIEAANKMSGVMVGKTLTCAHLSELSLWPDPTLLTKMIWPSLPNLPRTLAFMESTARGRQNFWFDLWKGFESGEDEWHPVFIEYYRVKKYSIPLDPDEKFERTPEEIGLAERAAQRGFSVTDEALKWRREKIRQFTKAEGDEWGFYQEYPADPAEAFQASGLCAFNKKRLHEISVTTCCPPLYYGEINLVEHPVTKQPLKAPTFKIGKRGTLRKVQPGQLLPEQKGFGGRFRIWEWPKPNDEYVIGADVAQGIEGGDFSSAYVLKKGRGPRPDILVANWHGWIGPTPYAKVLAAIGYFYNGALIACEANDIGRLTNQELFRVLEYSNIFQWKNYDKIQNFMSDWFGWFTNSKTRPELISKGREAIDDYSLVIPDGALVDQMFDFSSIEGGKFEGHGINDDRVMSALIARYCAHDMDWAYPTEAPRVSPENEGKGKDFFNTDYSPLHDYPQGLRQQMYEERKTPADKILYSELEGMDPEGEPDWRLL